MTRMFGTDGVRGIANVGEMTAEMVLEIGRATAYVCKKHNKNGRHRIVIGKDTRVSGYMLESALTAGICSMGVDVLLLQRLEDGRQRHASVTIVDDVGRIDDQHLA